MEKVSVLTLVLVTILKSRGTKREYLTALLAFMPQKALDKHQIPLGELAIMTSAGPKQL
jgi:hypothetical protein